MLKQERDLRIMVVKGPLQLVKEWFNGFTVDGRGTVRVGETDIHPQELGHGLAETAAIVNDQVAEHLETDDKELIGKVSTGLFNDPELLPERQELLETVIYVNREVPNIEIARQ